MDNNEIGDAINAAMQLNYMVTRMEIILIDKWNPNKIRLNEFNVARPAMLF